MEEIRKQLTEIKKLIGQNKIKKALDLLIEKIETEHLNELILSSARLVEIETASRQNLIDWDSVSRELSRIRKSVLEIVDEIEASTSNEQVKIGTTKDLEQIETENIPIIPFDDKTIIGENTDEFESFYIRPANYEEIILEFLENHKDWYFSSKRILLWGANRPGFHLLGNLDIIDLELKLEKLFKEGKLMKGKTPTGVFLYRINDI